MNNIGVHSFLQDHNFTKSYARPPVIGEENEVTSVDGRMSTHSSVSGKSEVSSATPRRTDIDLGFEPEGSASPLPVCERWKSSLHNVLEDSEGIKLFKKFLADGERQELLDCWLACKGFRDFGTKNNCSNNSSAASSTTGPLTAQRTQMDLSTLQTRGKLARKIFNTFLKKDKCVAVSSIIKDATRQYIYKQIKNALQAQKSMSTFDLDASLFDQAQNEIEHNLEENSYVSFLKSDLFKKHAAQHENKHAKQTNQAIPAQNQSENRNSQPNAQQVAVPADPTPLGRYGYLPRLDEDRVWQPPFVRSKSENTSVDKDQSLNSSMSSGVSQSSLARATMKRNMAASHERYSNLMDGPDQNHPAYPYFAAPNAAKYYVPPASANASDNASSDATSDTLSITDGSLDIEGSATYNSKKSQKRIMRHQIKRNPAVHYPAGEHFISLTRRCQYKQSSANMATDNPKQFFAQLKEKLDKVVEERRKKEITEAAASDNVNEILDSHIERVMKTPNPMDSPHRNQSPPPVIGASHGASQQRVVNFTNALPPHLPPDERHCRPPQKDGTDRPSIPHRLPNADHAVTQKKTDSLKRRKEVVVGMAPNEVPDVTEVSAKPVDKNYMIQEWIKQTLTKSGTQTGRRGSVSKSGKSTKFINRGDSFPIQAVVTSKVNQFHTQPLQPTSQDRMMPPLEQPDASTTIEEVKRRLIEETERSYITDPIRGLNLDGHNTFTHPYTDFEGTFAGPLLPTAPYPQKSTELKHSASVSPTVESAASNEVHGDAPHLAKGNCKKTTCLYYMPHEVMGYKIQIPHSPVTLGQFKTYLGRKGNYKYYFKQYSKEIDGPVYFEFVKDNERLPLWDNVVVAKVVDHDS